MSLQRSRVCFEGLDHFVENRHEVDYFWSSESFRVSLRHDFLESLIGQLPDQLLQIPDKAPQIFLLDAQPHDNLGHKG